MAGANLIKIRQALKSVRNALEILPNKGKISISINNTNNKKNINNDDNNNKL